MQYSNCSGRCFRCRFGIRLRAEANLRSILKCVALCCLVLTLWSACAFATHHHSNCTESAKCTVCVAALLAAPKTAASLLKATFSPVSTFQPESVSAKQHVVAFALSVRPPPPANPSRCSTCCSKSVLHLLGRNLCWLLMRSRVSLFFWSRCL